MPVQQSQAFSSGIYRIAIKLRGNSREKIELIKGNSSSNHVQLRTIRDYGVCSRQVTVAEIVMPIGRYIAWVGASLLMLLFVANWFLPQSLAEPTGDEINRPVIRIASMQQPPERIVIDTSLPTIVPPPTLIADAIPDGPPLQLQSYASVTPHTTVTGVEKTKTKANKRQVKEVAAKQAPSAGTTVVASGGSATIAPPTRLSLANIISGQLVRELFNLH